MPVIDNVTLDTAANVYFDGKCVSHTFHLADGSRKSAGVIFPSSLTFGTAAPEVMDIEAGRCRVTLGAQVSEYGAGSRSRSPGTRRSTSRCSRP